MVMWGLQSTLQKSLVAFVSTQAPCRTGGYVVQTVAPFCVRQFSSSLKASPPETQFILRYDYVADVLEKRGPYREEHLELARKMSLSGGPTTPLDATVPTGAFFTFATAEDAQEFAALDPYVTAGIVTHQEISQWTIAVKN